MVATDRIKLVLFAVSAVASVTLGFLLVPPAVAIRFVQHGGYFVVLAAFIPFVLTLIRLERDPSLRSSWSKADITLAAASLAIALLWQVNCIHGFKILMDEYVLNATAMSMHFDREAFVPLKTHDLNGVYATLGGVVDKRPLFFPFLLSVAHDLTGYRPDNVFFVNAVLSAILLFLVGRLGRHLGASTEAGLLAILLMGGLPLLASSATGAGFDLLNLVMISGVMLLALRFLERPIAATLDPLVFGCVLLAQSRYESAIFVITVGAIVLSQWWRRRRIIACWGLVVAPPLLVLIPFLNKIFQLNNGYWQLDGQSDAPFQWQFLQQNLGHALAFFFTVDGTQLGSPVLSIVGLISLVFFVVYLARRPRASAADGKTFVLCIFSATILGNFLLLLCYHWGQLDDYVASRLGLPLLLVFALASAFAIGRWVRAPRAWPPILVFPLTWLFLGALPIISKSQATRTFLAYREAEWQRSFVSEVKHPRSLFIFPSPLPAVVERRPAMPVEALNERGKEMAFHLQEKTYNEVYVFQRLQVDPVTREIDPTEQSRLGPEFILETIEERRFKPLFVSRLSRLVAVDLARRKVTTEEADLKFPPFKLNLPEGESTPAGTYLKELIENLP